MNPLSKLVCDLFLFSIDNLKLVWRFIIECAMRPLSIVELNVGINAFYKLLLRFVLCAIDFFPLHRCKKGLHDSVVMRLSGFGKRLDNLVHLEQSTERF